MNSSTADPLLVALAALARSGVASVHNARGGFACNSSSSHSIVVVADAPAANAPDDDYGWDDFVLTTSADKVRYLAAQLNSVGRPDLGALIAAEHQLGSLPSELNVDHQSVLTFPDDGDGYDLNVEFLRDFATALTDERIVILGGNDNDDRDLINDADLLALVRWDLGYGGQWNARKDTVDGVARWVLFNTFDGTKLSITFNLDLVLAAPGDDLGPRDLTYIPAKAEVPELVDVKLTDACPFETDCGWCFGGETEYLTKDGIKKFSDTVGTTQEVLVSLSVKPEGNPASTDDFGGVWRKAEIKSFGQQRLVKVTLKRFRETKTVYATPEHRWLYTPVRNSKGTKKVRRITTTSGLTEGMRLAPLFGRRTMFQGPSATRPSPFGVAAGFVFGDGHWSQRGSARVDLWGDKDAALLPYFALCKQTPFTNENGTHAVRVTDIPKHFNELPPLDENSTYLYGWLAGYFAADGAIAEVFTSPALDSAVRENLEYVQRVCNVLGIGTYGIKDYMRKGIRGVISPMYRLRFVSATLTPEFFILPEHRRRFEARKIEHQVHAAWTVQSVEETDRFEEVFCAVVPEYENFTLAGNINVMNCYMGSSVKGAAGEVDRIANVVTALADLGVFEIAFGGGEPTTWPHLGTILEHTRSLNVVPNFTTKNYTWLTGPHANSWLDLVGSVAFSVNTRTAMDRLCAKYDQANLTHAQKSKVTIQLIPDLVSKDDFAYIVAGATTRRWRITLLGYKETGRGATYSPEFVREPGWWIDAIIAASGRRSVGVAIDTALAEQSKVALAAANVPDWVYHTQEGAFSCYIDAVTSRMGPSSYCDNELLVPINLDTDVTVLAETIRSEFATYPGQDR